MTTVPQNEALYMIRQRLKAIFMGNAPFTVSMIGLLIVILVSPLYFNGYLSGINEYFIDSFYRLRLVSPKPRQDIVILGVTDETLDELGWPLPRQHYATLLKRLKADGVKAVGFNILLSSPSKQNPEHDQLLLKAAEDTPNLVMPFFYDYGSENNYQPMPSLIDKISALGNVSMYKGDVSRFIEYEILNQDASPRQVLFPMGLELARLSLDLPPQALSKHGTQVHLGESHRLYLEDNDLIRLHYQGPPNSFDVIPLHRVLSGQDKTSFRDKIVLLGAWSPTLGDVATSPYADQTTLPIYGVEVQAHLLQSILNQSVLYHVPPMWHLLAMVLIAISSGLVLTRFRLFQQISILAGLALGVIVLSYVAFGFVLVVLDVGPFITMFSLMGLAQVGVLNLRSYVAINDQISKLQEYEQKLPEVPDARRMDNILTSLFYISQADWVGYRRLDTEKQLRLHDVKSVMVDAPRTGDLDDYEEEKVPKYPYGSLPPYYPADVLNKLPSNRIIPLEPQQLPADMKQAYKDYNQGYFVLMPVHSEHRQVIGLFELYFSSSLSADEVPTSLLEELRDVAAESLRKFEYDKSSSRDLVPGVEEKILAMDRLVSIREVETAFFSTVLESTTNPVVVCDQMGEIRFYNDNFVDILQLEDYDDITSANIQALMSRIFQIMPQQWQDIWMTTLHRRKQKEVQVSTERGVYHLTLTPVFGQQSEVTGVVMILTDVTQLHRQANYDKLTGLFNRRYFDELIMKEFQRCQRNPHQPFSLILMDVDHFKSFNDTYGHQVGDQVLASFGQVISKTVRRTDMPVRYGGEETAVILPNTNAENAAIAGEKIRSAIESLQLYDLEGQPIRRITTSVGVTQFMSKDANPDEILRRADDALYQCKDAGRNCIHIHKGDGEIVLFDPGRMKNRGSGRLKI